MDFGCHKMKTPFCPRLVYGVDGGADAFIELLGGSRRRMLFD